MALCAMMSCASVPWLSMAIQRYQLWAVSSQLIRDLRLLQRQAFYQGCASCGIRMHANNYDWQITIQADTYRRFLKKQDYPVVRMMQSHVLDHWLPVNHRQQYLRAGRIDFQTQDAQVRLYFSNAGRIRTCALPTGFLGIPTCHVIME